MAVISKQLMQYFYQNHCMKAKSLHLIHILTALFLIHSCGVKRQSYKLCHCSNTFQSKCIFLQTDTYSFFLCTLQGLCFSAGSVPLNGQSQTQRSTASRCCTASGTSQELSPSKVPHCNLIIIQNVTIVFDKCVQKLNSQSD